MQSRSTLLTNLSVLENTIFFIKIFVTCHEFIIFKRGNKRIFSISGTVNIIDVLCTNKNIGGFSVIFMGVKRPEITSLRIPDSEEGSHVDIY